MQDIAVLGARVFQTHTNKFGLYCNVNRQVMELDRVS